MNPTLRDVCCASLPAAALPVLAAVRHVPNVRIRSLQDRVWIWWQAGDEEVLRCVLVAPGVELYERRGDLWYEYGHALPAFHLPAQEDTQPLYQALAPAPVQPTESVPGPLRPVTCSLVRDEQPRTTTALLTTAETLAVWARTVPTAALTALLAAHCDKHVLVRGRVLPTVPGGERFWGDRLLLPLGLRPELALPEQTLREALGVTDAELALCSAAGIEMIALDAFEPLTRPGVRLVNRQA